MSSGRPAGSRPVVAVLLFLAVAAAFIALRSGPRESSTPVDRSVERGTGGKSSGTPSTSRRAPFSTHELLDRLRTCVPSEQRDEIVQTASEMRKRARTDKDYMRSLIESLLDPSQPEHVREVMAFVLASLPDTEAQRALIQALEQGGESSWLRILILAIGSARDRGRDDSFGLPEGPWVKSTPSGLGVEIRTVLLDPAVRSAVEKRVEHEDAEVRRAVVQVLQHTLLYEARSQADGKSVDIGNTRKVFLQELDRDADESVRAEASRALAEWMMIAPEKSSGFEEVLQSILRKSMEPEEDQVRFRSLQGLKQTELPKDDLDRVFDRAMKGTDFESRAWAIELSAAHADGERQKSIMALAANDSDPKIRELALHQMTQMPGSGEAAELARHCLQDKEWNVRYAAVKALANQPVQPETLDVLERLSRTDDNEDVREIAEEALKQLRK